MHPSRESARERANPCTGDLSAPVSPRRGCPLPACRPPGGVDAQTSAAKIRMGITADVRAQLSGLFRDESGATDASKRFLAAITLLAEHAQDLEDRVAQLEREAKERD
jgi:hypothetical protein